MTDSERAVRSAWRSLGGDHESIVDVIARHREPHRRYHTVDHVAAVLRVVEEILDDEPVRRPDVVRAAAIFHDVVYDPRAADNEARSADLATAIASTALSWGAADLALLRQLILATAEHEPHEPMEAVLLDADLSIIGAPAREYRRYVDAVRAEYAHVDDAGWRVGRAAVLRSFLDRGWIYATLTMRDRCEERARTNLRAELASLE